MNERKTVMADMAIFSRSLLRKFIQLYKDLPCLWDRNCAAYKHKHKRHEAISKLTELLQQHFPRATRVHVLRKIESMRACVRREYKRVLDSRAKASHPDEVYAPQLWYYEMCLFMFGEDGGNYQGRQTSKQNADSEEDTSVYLEDDDEMPFEQSMESYPVDFKVSTSHERVERVDTGDSSSGHKRYLNDEATTSSKRHCTEIEDEYDAIGINVAAKLRALPANMRILAEKLVNDVLYQAQMNCLSSTTVISTPDPFKQDV